MHDGRIYICQEKTLTICIHENSHGVKSCKMLFIVELRGIRHTICNSLKVTLLDPPHTA